MTEFVLVGCTKTKRDSAADACDLYDESPLFRKRRKVARQRGDCWSILSAEHGLVRPSKTLEPYDTFIGDRDSDEWAEKVLDDLLSTLQMNDADTVTILAGSKYVDPLVTPLEGEGYEVLDPLRGLRPGERMSKLDDMADSTEQKRLITDGGQPHGPEHGTARLPPYAERIEKDDECRWVRCTVCGNEAPNLRHLEHDCIYSNDLVADGGSETYTSGTDRCWNCGATSDEATLAYSAAVDDLVCVPCSLIEYETGQLPAEGEI